MGPAKDKIRHQHSNVSFRSGSSLSLTHRHAIKRKQWDTVIGKQPGMQTVACYPCHVCHNDYGFVSSEHSDHINNHLDQKLIPQ